jgi:hypothetical protein
VSGTNKFIQWDQNGTNMYSDATYATQTAITDGVSVGEIADPDLHNKLFYQISTMCAAWGQVFSDLGYDINDSSITALTNILNNTVITDNMWSTFTGDFHSQTTNGFYATSTITQTNAPNATDKFYLIVAVNSTYIYHLAMSVENGTHFYNVYNGSTWSGWSQIATKAELDLKLSLSGGNMTGAINETLITMASASTMNIGAAAANYIIVTGTNTITAFDTIQPGTKRQLRFSSPLTVTYNATTMLLPGGTNINVIAGDVMEFVSGGSGIWRCTKYQPWLGNIINPSSSVQGDILYHNGTSYARLAAGTSGQVLQTNGSSANPSWVTSSAAAIAILNETQTSGTAGGTFTNGAWRTRTLNTTEIDQIGITLSSNQFTLPAGTYEIRAKAPAYSVLNHKARLQNITDSTTAIIGSSEYCFISGTPSCTSSEVIGLITISASKVFEIQHYCNTTGTTNGFGVPASFSVSEIYTQVVIRKVG